MNVFESSWLWANAPSNTIWSFFLDTDFIETCFEGIVPCWLCRDVVVFFLQMWREVFIWIVGVRTRQQGFGRQQCMQSIWPWTTWLFCQYASDYLTLNDLALLTNIYQSIWPSIIWLFLKNRFAEGLRPFSTLMKAFGRLTFDSNLVTFLSWNVKVKSFWTW